MHEVPSFPFQVDTLGATHSVVVPGCEKVDAVALDLVDQTVLFADASGLLSRALSSERLSLKRVAQDVFI